MKDHTGIGDVFENYNQNSARSKEAGRNHSNHAADSQLFRTEQLYKSIADHTADLIGIFDTEGNYVYVSPSHKKVLGYDPAELISANVLSFLHPDEHEITKQLFEDLQKNRNITNQVFRFRHKDGSWKSLETTGDVIFRHDGTPVNIVCISKDITTKIIAEDELKNSRFQLQNAINAANLGSWEYDLENDTFLFNDCFYRIFRTTREIEGTYTMNSAEFARRFVHPDDLYKVQEEITKMKESDDPEFCNQLEFRSILSDGEIVYMGVRYCIKKDSSGKTIKAYGVNQDITSRKNAEQKLKDFTEQLRGLTLHLEKIREQERMTIARDIHDVLGSSLAAMKMELCSLREEISERYLKKHPELFETLDYLNKLTNDTIHTMRCIIRQLRPEILDELGLAETIKWHANEIHKRTGIDVSVIIPAARIRIMNNRAIIIFRIFQEIMTNIVHHSRADMVSIILKKKKGIIFLEVTDNGKGITRDEIERKDSYGILGMKERTLLLKGKFSITGYPEEGTKVSLEVPVVAM